MVLRVKNCTTCVYIFPQMLSMMYVINVLTKCWPFVTRISTNPFQNYFDGAIHILSFKNLIHILITKLCIKWLIKMYTKNAKISENEKNKRCAYINIFKRIVDMIMIVFVGSKTLLRLLLTRISWPQDSYSKKAPPFLAFVTFLANFYPLWTNRGLNINI